MNILKIRTIVTTAICLALPFLAGAEKHKSLKISSDGPYIFYDANSTGARIVEVSPEGEILDRHIDTLQQGWSFDVRSENGEHTFKVSLHEISTPASFYPKSSRTYVISDPHANFECFYSILRAGSVIDEECRWSFGDGHLVIIGDVMDRGVDATTIFWLIYKLEAEANAAGGHLSFLLGNHEPMVLMNDTRYTSGKYLALADTLNMSCSELYGPDTELGRWIISRNAMIQIDKDLFVHAGLSPDLYNLNLPIDTINAGIRRGLYLKKKQRKEIGGNVYFLFASTGPVWYRGLVIDKPDYRPSTADSLQMVLDLYNADRLYVGHTIFKEVTRFYNGKVIAVNVDNKKARREKRPRAVMISDGRAILFNDKGSTGKEL